MNAHTTAVIFRKFKNGEIIALFPEEPGTNNPSTCNSYMHVGQHGAADPHHEGTKPAKPSEYSDLARELRRIGYRLRIIKRNNRAHYRARVAEIHRTGHATD